MTNISLNFLSLIVCYHVNTYCTFEISMFCKVAPIIFLNFKREERARKGKSVRSAGHDEGDVAQLLRDLRAGRAYLSMSLARARKCRQRTGLQPLGIFFFARIGRTILPKNSKRSGRLSATN